MLSGWKKKPLNREYIKMTKCTYISSKFKKERMP
jgi:hypothetical protein